MLWILFLCFIIGLVQCQLDRPSCDLTQVTVQPNFDIQRYLGRWNELIWVAPEEEKDYDATDYFWLLSNQTRQRHGRTVISGIQSGRDYPSGQCFGGTLTLTETDTPGILMLDANNGYKTLYYILSTDYVTYANVYGCYDYNHDASLCYRGRAWLWSRGTSLPSSKKKQAISTWQNLCLDLDTLTKYTAFPGNDCSI